MPKIDVFLVDPDTFDDILIGSITIDGGSITSDNDDLLLDLAHSSGDSPEEILKVLSDWSNGYLRTELAKEPLQASGTIKLVEVDQDLEASGIIKLSEPVTAEEPAPSSTIKLWQPVPEELGVEEPVPSGTIKLKEPVPEEPDMAVDQEGTSG